MNKYEARMKVSFYLESKTVKTLTLIGIVEAEDTIKAIKEVNTLMANLRRELQPDPDVNSYSFDELINYLDVDGVIVEVSAIVPTK